MSKLARDAKWDAIEYTGQVRLNRPGVVWSDRKAHVDIKDRRAEILRLIAKVHGAPRRRPSVRKPPEPERGVPRATQRRQHARQAAEDRLQTRQRDLSNIKDRKRRLEATFLDTGVLDLLKRLDDRIEKVESILQNGVPAQQTLLPPPSSSVEFASDLVLGGRIREGLLADMLQLVSSNVLTGIFTIKDSMIEVHLYFREGEIVHADGEGLSGENAVFAGMAVEEGTYRFTETTDIPEEQTITSKTQFLILEALRQIDEAGA